ncbi:NAD-dependent epimerase/dehydratase family protein [Rhizobium sp. TH2]|uniref:NAD-dependent epimerase/dehydratase family protein n=1 Tax=Rhizobium sp. TH2 TaxID=2775403 RepID=UPI002157637A|nr:NAD-dependent epimerase/dehydratase family protein [Rhizobium sp. TH2]UVC07551.1 NAD-dependent epimerase/dehydratase family protein [Rhizobium sp. TH2]
MKKRILLTGASGFVGRQVARALIEAGHGLVVTMRPGGLERSGLGAHEADVIETPDLFAESEAWWAPPMAGVDAVIHAAWSVEPGKYLDSSRNVDCVAGSLRLADAARRAGVGQFIGIGTCFEYRLPNDRITADAPLGPVTLYAAAKLALYHMLERRFAETGTQLTWARLFYLFGVGEHPARLFPMLHRKLAAGEMVELSSGDKIRDFLDVAEAGSMIARVAGSEQAGVVNICSGKPVTIREIAEEIADIHGRRDLLRFGTANVHPRDPFAVVGVPNIL